MGRKYGRGHSAPLTTPYTPIIDSITFPDRAKTRRGYGR